MKKFITPTVLVLLSAAVVYMFIAYKPGVKPIYYQSFPQITQTVSPPSTGRIAETSGYDYSTNLIVGNILGFTPTTVSYSLISKDIGQAYYDKISEDLRFADGNYPAGVKFVFGKYANDTITINTTQDTVNFPPLLGTYAYNVTFKVMYDSINAAGCTINFQQTFHIDSTYLGLSDSFFPQTLATGESNLEYVTPAALKFQRAIVDWIGTTQTATVGNIIIEREITVLP